MTMVTSSNLDHMGFSQVSLWAWFPPRLVPREFNFGFDLRKDALPLVGLLIYPFLGNHVRDNGGQCLVLMLKRLNSIKVDK